MSVRIAESAVVVRADEPPVVAAATHAYVDQQLDDGYIRALEAHNAALTRAALGESTLGELAPANNVDASAATAGASATSVSAAEAPAPPAPVLRPDSILFECFCFQPSPANGGVGGADGCRHSEIRLETQLWAYELKQLFHEESRVWERDVAAPHAAFQRRLARGDGAEAQWQRQWRDQRMREVVETLAAEERCGKQLRYQ